MAHYPRTDGKPPRSHKAKTPHPLVARVQTTKGAKPAIQLLDEGALYEAARTHASFETLEKIFGIPASTLSTHAVFRPIIDKARAEQRKKLLDAQFRLAIDDRNPTMQIWLGKQYLDQKDVSRVESTGKDGEAIKSVQTIKAVAYIPENGRDE